MNYNGTGINDSATIIGKAAKDIANGAFKAAKLCPDGIELAAAGDVAVGILIPETESPRAGDDVVVQVKDMGLGIAGAAIEAGALLAADANGKLVAAASGAFIVAQAMEGAEEADQVITVQIIKAGYAAAAKGGSDAGDDNG